MTRRPLSSSGQTSTELLVIGGVTAAILIGVLVGFRTQVGSAMSTLGRCVGAAAGGSMSGCGGGSAPSPTGGGKPGPSLPSVFGTSGAPNGGGGNGGAAAPRTTPPAPSAPSGLGSLDPNRERQRIRSVIRAATAPDGPPENWQEGVAETWSNILSPGRVKLQQENLQTGDQWFNRGMEAIRRAEAALAAGHEDEYRRAMEEAGRFFGRANTFYALANSDKAQLAEQAMNEVKEIVYDPARAVIKNFGFILPKPMQQAFDRTFGAIDIVLDGEMNGWDKVTKDKAKEIIMSKLMSTKFDKLGGKSMNEVLKDAQDIAKDKAYSNQALRNLQEQLTGNPEYAKEMEKVVKDLSKEMKDAREATQEAIRRRVNKG